MLEKRRIIVVFQCFSSAELDPGEKSFFNCVGRKACRSCFSKAELDPGEKSFFNCVGREACKSCMLYLDLLQKVKKKLILEGYPPPVITGGG